MIELISVEFINGERTNIDYAYRKSSFTSVGELESYRLYLEKKLKQQLFLSYIDKREKTEQMAKG